MVKLLLRQMGIMAQMDLIWLLKDTRIFLIQFVGDVALAVASISGVMMMSSRFGGIGGMGHGEVLFMLGYAHLVHGITGLFFGFNTAYISRTIGRGQLDHVLIQPLPIWIQLATSGFMPISGLAKPAVGGIVMFWAMSGAGIVVTFAWMFGLVLCLMVSIIIALSVVYLSSCAAFYAPVAAEEISSTVWELFSTVDVFPLGSLPMAAKFILCGLIPVGCVAWLPTGVLFQGFGAEGAVMLFVMLIFFSSAVLMFRKGLAHYVKTGSRRYHNRGHRR